MWHTLAQMLHNLVPVWEAAAVLLVLRPYRAWLAEHAEAMTGTWIDTPVVGLMEGQPFPMLGGPEPVDLTAIDGGFSGVGEEPAFTYELLLTEDPFTIDPPGGAAALTRIDAEDIPECAIADLPRLTANYRLNIEGDMVDGTIAVVVASTTRMLTWFRLETGFGTIEMQSVMTR